MKHKQSKVADSFAEQTLAANVTFDQFRGRMIAPQACAKALDNSEFTIHRWIRMGKIRAVKLSSRCTRIDGDSLANFLCAHTFTHGTTEPQPDTLKTATEKRKHTAIELAGQA